MKKQLLKKRKYILLNLFLLVVPFVQAQNVIPASGGEASGSGGSVSYSVGQVVYSNNTGANADVTEGVQQPYEIFVVSEVDLLPSAILSFKAYPNPVADFLILDKAGDKTDGLLYQLSDLNGKIIKNGILNGEYTIIPIGEFRDGNYFLSVLQGDEILKAFKIVKK